MPEFKDPHGWPCRRYPGPCANHQPYENGLTRIADPASRQGRAKGKVHMIRWTANGPVVVCRPSIGFDRFVDARDQVEPTCGVCLAELRKVFPAA